MDDTDRFILLASLWLVYVIALLLLVWAAAVGGRALRRTLYTTAMSGPGRTLSAESPETSKLYQQYGPVFQVPIGLFSKEIVLCDAAAIAHFYANAPSIYHATKFMRQSIKNLVGRGLIWTDVIGKPFLRCSIIPLWKATRPFSWIWLTRMNSVILDSIGVAGFSHDFESLSGNYCTVTAAFRVLRAESTGSLADTVFSLAAMIPLFRNIPTTKNRIINDFQTYMSRIAEDVLQRNAMKGNTDKSVLGLLIKSLAEHPAGEFRLSHAEVLAQIVSTVVLDFRMSHNNVEPEYLVIFWVRNYRWIKSHSQKWLLVELAKNPTIQEKLRDELQQNGNISYAQISRLLYLHAVVYEALRLHPPIGETTRVAVEDDVIPLSSPVTTKSGETVTSINVAKGTVVTAPVRWVNTSDTFWGPGASKFDPGRWWQDKSNVDFPGNRHLAFGDGPRTCLGVDFSLTLIKIVLSVIVKNFAFSLPEGPHAIIETTGRCVPQPRVSGQGSELLMVVRKLE
ncbi:cytochrome P450 [Mycena epipterygia]|nr:cytochrome P450 [Mycena epipterygia]